ncbi:MAG: type III pantothenate kinase, partial [Lentisphaeraceae bacterium]|nr:type III pantothenate kinase [Lentisphaeraceae bacterium]
MKIGLLNIGNTHSEICSYDLSGRRKVLTENLLDDSASFLSGFTDVYTASVVAETIEALKRQYENIRFHELTVDKISSVDFSKVDASSLGADRLANIIAAKSFYRGSVLVVDCGTCVTA